VRYPGPLRDEPVAIELSNTLYVSGGELHDGLAEPASATAFVRAMAPRLGGKVPMGTWPAPLELVALRTAVRAALQAAAAAKEPPVDAVAAINAAAARAPGSPRAVRRAGALERVTDHGRASRADVVLAGFAAGAIDLLTGPSRDAVRACGAPGCVLLYVRDHPRRQWCSNACGNRARQARHYRRTHEAAPEGG
jgi:predicted RNA-binding Zn ribbon-like protein